MLRNKQYHQQKAARKLYKEYNELQTKRFSEGVWVDVEPYQSGWCRYYVLREDIRNRRDSREIQKMLDMINVEAYSRDGKFMAYDYKQGCQVPIRQEFRKSITPKVFATLSEKIQSFLCRQYNLSRDGLVQHEWYWPKLGYWFEFRVVPNIIVQHYIPNFDVERRLAETNKHIKNIQLWDRWNKFMGGPSKKDGWRRKGRNSENFIMDLEEDSVV